MIYPAKYLYKEEIARKYDKERFTSLKGKLYDWFEKRSITRALKRIPKNASILDIPCGTGRITEHIKKLGYPVSGADISMDMLKIASNRSDINYFHRDILNINIPWGHFFVITCVRMMGHLPGPLKLIAIKEMKKVAPFSIITIYVPKIKKSNWYTLEAPLHNSLFKLARVSPIGKYKVCPYWSDGITYLLEHH